ncbi:MAG TPA: hypothetical protein VIH90_06305 [Candidatus Saccharimonadales bacterium]
MTNPDISRVSLRETVMPIAEAEDLIWRASSLLLIRNRRHQPTAAHSESQDLMFGRLFENLAVVGGVQDEVSFKHVVAPLDAQTIETIMAIQEASPGAHIMPHEIEDINYHVAYEVRQYLEATHRGNLMNARGSS